MAGKANAIGNSKAKPNPCGQGGGGQDHTRNGLDNRLFPASGWYRKGALSKSPLFFGSASRPVQEGGPQAPGKGPGAAASDGRAVYRDHRHHLGCSTAEKNLLGPKVFAERAELLAGRDLQTARQFEDDLTGYAGENVLPRRRRLQDPADHAERAGGRPLRHPSPRCRSATPRKRRRPRPPAWPGRWAAGTRS